MTQAVLVNELIGERVRQHRTGRGWTLDDLADALQAPVQRRRLDELLINARLLQTMQVKSEAAIVTGEESLRLNPRRSAHRDRLEALDSVTPRLGRIVTRVRGMTRTVHDLYDVELVREPTIADIVLAVHEIATNSIRYGGGTGDARVWRDDSTLVCEIRDRGHITDPLAGRRAPPGDAVGGRGIWIANHLADLVQLRSSSSGTIVRVHVLGNVLGPVFVYATSLVSVSMILASGLSFLGLGVRPPEPEWGLMLNTLRTAIYSQPWVAALPGAAIFVVSISFNIVSDGLRSAMQVKQ